LSVLQSCSIVALATRRGSHALLSAILEKHYGAGLPEPGRLWQTKEISLRWAGPDRYYAIANESSEGAFARNIKELTDGRATCVDQSHGRVLLSLSGPGGRQLLARGTSVDLHVDAFRNGHCAVTQMAHVDVHLSFVEPSGFELLIPRASADSFWGWLTI